MIAKFIDLDDIGCNVEFKIEQTSLVITTKVEGHVETYVSLDNCNFNMLVNFLNIELEKSNKIYNE